MGFNLVNPVTFYSYLASNGSELCNAFSRVLDDFFRIGNAVFLPELHQVLIFDTHGFAVYSQVVGRIELVAWVEAGECQVVGRCDVPAASFLHHEGEVADMGINIGSKDVIVYEPLNVYIL